MDFTTFSLLPFFEWCEASWIGNSIRTSLWLFPVIEAVHLLGLCLLGGAVLIVDLRMLGAGLRQPIARHRAQCTALADRRIVVMLTTGTALFLSESIKCYYNTSFWVKITTLPIALLFTFTQHKRIALPQRRSHPPHKRDRPHVDRACGLSSPPPAAGSGFLECRVPGAVAKVTSASTCRCTGICNCTGTCTRPYCGAAIGLPLMSTNAMSLNAASWSLTFV